VHFIGDRESPKLSPIQAQEHDISGAVERRVYLEQGLCDW